MRAHNSGVFFLIINVSAYTGRPYQQQRFSRPASAAGVSAVLLIGLECHREATLAALESYR